ncbi:type I restriction enzyme HsdR N-terminal domain-containing protein [Halosquirtibacter laminarini]|uniref:Type I restriction enzyme HsdR N-terminal domain-containing protein n=1 Tax=Halosquirtibacter laminarini TaxID=3374600 RepID=A0AC61NKQ1_9BACT|nr:type I restriction enzyme HsdR N-terminal domain-containing protein [Prolixibacteraceae bacterium]
MKDQINSLIERISTLKERIETEEATKNAFVMPFLQALGYDVFNPLEVIPEYVADQSTKKGEKVDYCILKDDDPIIIIECKKWQENLDLHNTQLERYFAFTKAKFGILTNGIEYFFYTDLEEVNKMDAIPFLKVNLENLKDQDLTQLNKFHKSEFNVDQIFDSASELKYLNAIKYYFENELNAPSSDFVRFFTKQVYQGKITEKVSHQFTPIVKKALNAKINETINQRLNSALNSQTIEQKEEVVSQENLSPDEIIIAEDADKGIVTTQEEVDAYNAIVDILDGTVEKEHIAFRDTKSYFGVLFDDNNRQPICRLYLNHRSKKYIGIFDEDKNEKKYQICKIAHIYKYSKEIIKAVEKYLVVESE